MREPQRIEHLWARPAWDCRTCERPWPCPQAKEALLEEFRYFPSVLSIYLFGQLTDAVDDMTAHGQTLPPDLFERFLAWAVPRTNI
ncbi:hypothetical protein Acsp02_19100 [Actinoplanes sp. NBRC 103695]|nr:hypothetical protein Acsp02_19100 [Actinoplanes sp. NBRC 103695]